MSNVLLVEDSATQALEIRLLLEESGHQVVVAGDGASAMRSIQETPPDVVVTDLEMPNMTGLELVEAMQATYPQLPAILITSQGSETLAVQALRRGAAAYVPKTMMGMLLATTIRDVLGVLRADQSYAQLVDALTHNRFEFALPSEPFLLPPLVDLIVQMVSGMRLMENTELIRFSAALDNALHYGMLHGNLELNAQQANAFREQSGTGSEPSFLVERRGQTPYRERRLHVDIDVREDQIVCQLRDQGAGFDRQVWSEDAEAAIEHEDGSGIGAITSFMDEVSIDGDGHTLTLRKYCTRHAQPTG